MSFDTWVASIPPDITRDPLWRMKAYQLSLFAVDVGWQDVLALDRRSLTRASADQLQRALGSVGANLAEGYSRSSGRDRIRFFEYALGSARESRHWYHATRRAIGPEDLASRTAVLTSIIRLLLHAIPAERTRLIERRRIDDRD